MTPGTLLRHRRSGRTVRVVAPADRPRNGAVPHSPMWSCVDVVTQRPTRLQEATMEHEWDVVGGGT